MANDCINREDVITIIARKHLFKDKSDFDKCVHTIAKQVKALPPVTPTSRWIPVSERLPEKSMDIMVCDEFGAIFLAHFNKGYSFDEYTVAWMPLPEPYKAESEEG